MRQSLPTERIVSINLENMSSPRHKKKIVDNFHEIIDLEFNQTGMILSKNGM